jgi:hypothetical protein
VFFEIVLLEMVFSAIANPLTTRARRARDTTRTKPFDACRHQPRFFFAAAGAACQTGTLNHTRSRELTRSANSTTTPTGELVPGMRQEDLNEMADRCRALGDLADDFTKKRLLDLALKYEARSTGRSLATQRLVSISRKEA